LVEVMKQNGQSILRVRWNDGLESVYSKQFLKNYLDSGSQRYSRYLDTADMVFWNEPKVYDIAQISYDDYMSSAEQFKYGLRHVHKYGLIFVTGIPKQESSEKKMIVKNIAERIGYIKQTFYGSSWDVISVPNPKNIAYSSVYLPLHMDLLYYESPPGIQLLHVIENSTRGGESVFADSFAAALHVLKTNPEAYDALTRIPISFHYDHPDCHYYHQHSLITEDKYGPIDKNTGRRAIKFVNYSPPFQAPLDALATDESVSDNDFELFMQGLKIFEEYIENPRNQIECRMEEDTCMIFCNRRILHGRRAYEESSGRRFFKGTYLDIDSFYSTLRTI